MKKIGIDARFYGPGGKGLGRYAQKLVQYLEETDGGSSEREYLIFLRKDNFDQYQPSHSNFKKILIDISWYSWREQTVFPLFLYRQRLDLVHFCHFNVPWLYFKKFTVTIHDLILFHYPTVRNTTLTKHFYFIKLLAYQFIIRSAARRAKRVIAVSKFTKEDIITNLKVSADKVDLAYEGCEFKCFVGQGRDEEILGKYGIIKPYLLYVGNAYPHKNLERLIEVFNVIKLQEKDLQLVLVGGKDFFYSRLEDFVKKGEFKEVVFPGYVPDEELDILYKEAETYVFPSLYEGFGLPPLEALAKNTKVASSNRSSMPEILGDTADYFNPEDLSSMEESIKKSLKRKQSKDKVPEEVISCLKKFSWEKMAQETLEIYKKALK